MKLHMSEVEPDRESGDKEEEFEVPSLKENEEFQAAVTEVKVAAKNVTDSTVALTNTIVKKGPNILGILLRALVSNELRCVPFRFYRFFIVLHLLYLIVSYSFYSPTEAILQNARNITYPTGLMHFIINESVFLLSFSFIFLVWLRL
jgi:hypothetical protein